MGAVMRKFMIRVEGAFYVDLLVDAEDQRAAEEEAVGQASVTYSEDWIPTGDLKIAASSPIPGTLPAPRGRS